MPKDSFGSRLKHAWNAFLNRDPTEYLKPDLGYGYFYRPDRLLLRPGTERSIVTSVYNRIAMDVAAISFNHVRLDNSGRFLSVIESGLNTCLTTEANKDQTGRAFLQDAVMSMLDEGCIALVPVDTSVDPKDNASFDVLSLRVARITEWFPDYVRVDLYNDRIGKREEIVLPKHSVAVIENPLYAIINEPNSTMQRLIRKMALLDSVDEQTGAGKLDLIIQLPYVIKTDLRKQQANRRRLDIEEQLAGSKYGIAYTDGTEKVTQLNRPVENNIQAHVEYLTSMLYGQLGITPEVLNGSADEKTMLNYTSRTVEPIAAAFTDEMKRKFLTKTARTQHQSIMFFKDPFKLVPVGNLADIADKLTRNEIMSSNEIRQIVGMKPSEDPRADELRNKNLNEQANLDAANNPVLANPAYSIAEKVKEDPEEGWH